MLQVGQVLHERQRVFGERGKRGDVGGALVHGGRKPVNHLVHGVAGAGHGGVHLVDAGGDRAEVAKVAFHAPLVRAVALDGGRVRAEARERVVFLFRGDLARQVGERRVHVPQPRDLRLRGTVEGNP